MVKTNNSKVALGCIRLTKDDSNADFIHKFMKTLRDNKIRPELLLMNREFFSVNVMSELEELEIKFLMPAVKYGSIKKAIEEYVCGNRGVVSKYIITNKFGNTATLW